MRRSLRAIVALSTALLSGAVALSGGAATPTIDHVCAIDEGKGVCSLGMVRMCAKDGSLAACACAPGMSSEKPGASCTIAASAKAPAPCVVPDATIGKTLGAALELGELAVPTLPSIAFAGAIDVVGSLDAKTATLDADGLLKLADAHQAIEGEAAFQASSLPKAKATALLMKRDASLSRAIDVRKAFIARFPGDPRVPIQRVSLARALLRRAAYAGVSSSVAIDRAAASAQLTTVIADAPTTPSARNAAFILGEQAVREKSWASVVAFESDVLKCALPKADVDDHAYLAAAYARMAQARLELSDVAAAKGALIDAIESGLICAPRLECVSASSGARAVLASVWAATGTPARAMLKLLQKGAMPRQERVRPLVRLAEIDAGASTIGACLAAAEEARAYAQIIK